MKSLYLRHELKIAITATAIIFLALIRTIAEPFRLHYVGAPVDYFVLKPLLTGAIIAATALFAMALLAFYNRYTVISFVSALTIILLLLVKTGM